MHPQALEKAHIRLRVARHQANAMKVCKNYGEFSEAWYVFLHAAKGIYTTLDQGSRATPQARQWFGKKNQERKDDPLLRYVTEARNDDEHGIEATSRYQPGEALMGVSQPGMSTRMIDDNGNVYMDLWAAAHYDNPTDFVRLPRLRSLDGKPVENQITFPAAHLVRVHDRSGRAYDPPTAHLGSTISNPTPLTVAEMMLDYLDRLVAEAEGLQRP